MSDVEVSVLIVGGGGCGLTTSLFLSDLGVDHLLVERRESTSVLPRAHYLNQRTMEIFRQHGVAEDVYRESCPLENMSEVVWRTSLAGDGPLDGRDLHRMDAFGGGTTAGPYAADSPSPSTNFPQHNLEPVLRRHADERAPDRVRFNHVMEEFTQDEDGVTAVVTDRETGESQTIRARYLVAADGGRSIGASLGVEMAGEPGAFQVMSVHFTADLSESWPGDSVLMTHFVSPDGGPISRYGIVAVGPGWGLHSQDWALHYHIPVGSTPDFSSETAVLRVRELLKLPDLEVAVHQVSHYVPEAVIADTFRVGRVFLAGDAAHRQPPATGLGLNSAIQDAHNLAWKLAAVLDGQADDALLDTFEQERLPVAHRNVSWAMYALRNHAVAHAGLGLLPGQPLEATQRNFLELFSDTPMGETRRIRAHEVFTTQRVEYQAHDIEIGFSYAAGALVADESQPPPRDPMGGRYHPVTRPGHRLPHVWLRKDGERVSSHDLVGAHGGFVLITGPENSAWVDAAERVAATHGVALQVVSVGTESADYQDVDGGWAALRQVPGEGAVLVRPDNHVAWRTERAGTSPASELTEVFARILGKPALVASGG
ncbi:FAD-dependent monooxygenase [Actinoalloteichus hymeniacidonis]|uniref:2-polyprenyl-6-methoxyphenol hydroxylase-like oxidoreductase n=1 Tax=Actinoalloteichus hymeniacidonis TaxID=340345 RepID=A0AAC9HSU5_9PSEU|nr:FAD-dependent monooxygenase [Actinoalloteichus hymeniacidonis]AOS64496.1 2-polyprenyl-6-methoxyphenol hydroxylase-like oxidoreductase [Actinoalloteichus hymeniacidonis]MBB5907433.1 2,4-dichlorophenol 6-monooxygenase [Actinoalloteichus hymeniacidonis]